MTIALLWCCDRSEFLDAKPDASLSTPRTLMDLQAILDFDTYINGIGTSGRGPVPALGEIGAGDYYVLENDFNNILTPQMRNYYRWDSRPYTGEEEHNWNYAYLIVFNCNVVLDALPRIGRTTDPVLHDRLHGSALFHRAHAFYQLAQVFAPPYSASESTTAQGIPLRLSADVNEQLRRATLEETYRRIIGDLEKASALLDTRLTLKTRPSRQAALGLLARTYQTMRDYGKARLYSDSCLAIQRDLIDYNGLNAALNFPFSGGAEVNPEVIFSCNMTYQLANPMNPLFAKTDTLLFKLYDERDLRRKVFFRESNGKRFKGSYAASATNFAGIATDEILLIRAECQAREGRVVEALLDLNRLLEHRWDNACDFVPYTARDDAEALRIVLDERRRQLLFRGLRWTDLRRLNSEGHGIGLTRQVGGQTHELPPQDKRYTYPIPLAVMGFHPEMPDNER